MRWTALFALVVFWAFAAEAHSAPLHDPVALNIGLNCQWQQRCIAEQNKAMKHALKYVKKYQPPPWRIQMCNKNASRKRFRVDWVGFNNCVRNASLRPLPPRQIKRRVRPISQASPPPTYSKGERGH